MIETITAVNTAVNNFIWGVPAMICIIGVGLLLSFRTGFIQIRKFPYAMKVTLGRMLKKREASDGALTPFQAVCTALAATVGTGNVAGVAGAIAIGGPGAVFWMWISALLGMCTKFSEVTLAVHFHERNANGDLVGGPMYYIKNGLKKHWHWLAYLFSAFGVLTVFGTGNATQVNTITTAIDSALYNYDIISIVVVIIGMLLFFVDSVDAGNFIGNILAIGTGFSLAGVTISLRMQKDGSGMDTVILGNLLAFLVSIPIILGGLPDMKSIIVIIIMGTFQLGIPYIFYINSTKYLSALEAILLTVAEPLLNPVWVFIFVGEKPGLYSVIGGIIVILSVTLRSVYIGSKVKQISLQELGRTID